VNIDVSRTILAHSAACMCFCVLRALREISRICTRFSLYQMHLPVKGTVRKPACYETTWRIHFLVKGIWGGEITQDVLVVSSEILTGSVTSLIIKWMTRCIEVLRLRATYTWIILNCRYICRICESLTKAVSLPSDERRMCLSGG
jgi:hypothetical protein